MLESGAKVAVLAVRGTGIPARRHRRHPERRVSLTARVRFDHPLYRGVPYDYGAIARTGAILFTAGACPLDAAGNLIGPGDHAAQATAALANLNAALELHGATANDLVRTTIFVVGDHDALVLVWNVIASGLAPHRPPSTLLGVTTLGYLGQLVEIDGIAALVSDDVSPPGDPHRRSADTDPTDPELDEIVAVAADSGPFPSTSCC